MFQYSNPILFVAKIPLLFREQGAGDREEVRVLKVLFTLMSVMVRKICS